jgi:hypothetical protein
MLYLAGRMGWRPVKRAYNSRFLWRKEVWRCRRLPTPVRCARESGTGALYNPMVPPGPRRSLPHVRPASPGGAGQLQPAFQRVVDQPLRRCPRDAQGSSAVHHGGRVRQAQCGVRAGGGGAAGPVAHLHRAAHVYLRQGARPPARTGPQVLRAAADRPIRGDDPAARGGDTNHVHLGECEFLAKRIRTFGPLGEHFTLATPLFVALAD